ncbi:MAG: DUF1080 domain-containing protein [Acidobacteria bacterium]|nr:DUF1080 domain-containing protein [Acidobacteriota bacterium]MBI3278545.1 DUF1080 domain-containing protein [Acidobacteriota bacterium]
MANLKRVCAAAGLLAAAAGIVCVGQEARKQRTSALGYSDTPVLPGQKWKVHDIERPRPRLVTPGAKPGDPPSDALVLFAGKDLSQWQGRVKRGEQRGTVGEARWKVENGYMYAPSGAGDLLTKEKFGDVQLHLEWSAPKEIDGAGQWRGNSGVLLMNRYEIQVLDSWDNPTYADGQAASIYGQWPPFVNASRRPGEWQTYDIVFEAPRFEGGTVAKPAFVTVFHNGVLMHHRQEIIGPMAHKIIKKYTPHGPEEPLALQDHDTRARFRNIWVRRLRGYDQP